jgi:hypothetical protein
MNPVKSKADMRKDNSITNQYNLDMQKGFSVYPAGFQN